MSTRPDRDRDWGARIAGLSQETVRAPRLEEIKRAALSAAQVTGDEHWDFFLSIVQEKMEDLRGQVETTVKDLTNSDIFTAENLINQKLAVRLLGRELEALEWVTSLPKTLMEQGDQAKQLIGNADKKPD